MHLTNVYRKLALRASRAGGYSRIFRGGDAWIIIERPLTEVTAEAARTIDTRGDEAGGAGSYWRVTFAELYQALTEQRCRLIVDCGDGPRLAVISEGALADLEGRGLASPQEVRLTQRELEVLALAATGHISDNIAAELGIARNTVAQHLAMVRRKLGVRTTSAAVYARRAVLL